MGFPGGTDGKESARNAGNQFRSLGQEDPLEERMATCSSVLAWRTPWTEEPDWPVCGVAENRTRLSDLACTHGLSAALRFYIGLSRSDAGSDQVPGMRKGARWGLGQTGEHTAPPTPA